MNQIPTTADLIKDADTASFPADVIEVSKQVPVLVDFWAPWCGPCKQLGPAIEKVVAAQNGAVRLVKINVDENQALAGQMGVQSIPAVFAFFNGQPVDGFMGALPESELTAFVTKLIDTATAAGGGAAEGAGGAEPGFEEQLAKALEMATEAMDAEQIDQAAQIYQMVLQQIPDNGDALVGMARCHLAKDDADGAQKLLDAVPDEARSAENFEAAQKTVALALEAAKLGDAGALAEKIEADPDDHQARIDLATILSVKGSRDEAAQALVDSFKRDREWNDAAARKKLLEFFEAWGPMDPATLKGRRLLSSVLFS